MKIISGGGDFTVCSSTTEYPAQQAARYSFFTDLFFVKSLLYYSDSIFNHEHLDAIL